MTKALLIQYIVSQSLGLGLDPSVALTVCKIESNFDAQAIGSKGEFGLFQLNPLSFKKYNKKQLLNPKLNARLGIKFLIKMKQECIHQKDLDRLLCYNLGIERAKTVRHPSLFPYVKLAHKVRKEYIDYKGKEI